MRAPWNGKEYQVAAKSQKLEVKMQKREIPEEH
jgi:hypothetical protein